MKYPMNFDMSVNELIDACDKPLDDTHSCENCILYRMCCWYYIHEDLEEEENV